MCLLRNARRSRPDAATAHTGTTSGERIPVVVQHARNPRLEFPRLKMVGLQLGSSEHGVPA